MPEPQEPLTLQEVAGTPSRFTTVVALPDGSSVLYRPLLPTDLERLAAFLESLSPATRRFWNLDSYNNVQAQAHIDAIARYDKLRLVALKSDQIIALFEFSFDLGSEWERFLSYNVPLNDAITCRFAPCLRDDYQGCGIGSALMPPTLELARQFGQEYMVLWGGVRQDNIAARRFYEKHGFRFVGAFEEPETRVLCEDRMLPLK